MIPTCHSSMGKLSLVGAYSGDRIVLLVRLNSDPGMVGGQRCMVVSWG
jgi:hypothetical protein